MDDNALERMCHGNLPIRPVHTTWGWSRPWAAPTIAGKAGSYIKAAPTIAGKAGSHIKAAPTFAGKAGSHIKAAPTFAGKAGSHKLFS